ncbi:MAG: succinate dehydrogenase [Methanobacteriota archaeon]|uniref:Succinate dehydrogenase n=1 Tax=Marine Group III euryarchaeote TaxID=2173149 RepID=A0A7C8DDN4_9ARCH|nr:MAG: succinate dehydrogenase [Euryarchaeota archaeon]HIG63883.1 succinate dehydrogenase [Marine Group III euryarchaeote]HIL32876.1 succinate dehydrogenase [Candidatus Poseidoniales archaeon]
MPCAIPGDEGLFPTARGDWWWAQPLAVFLGLATAVAYMTWAAFQGTNYHFDGGGANYLSPLYSPEFFGDTGNAIFGEKPALWPDEFLGFVVPWSPAFLILWAPAGFRLTCYYYRGAYYKSFWADPPACAVGEPRGSYWGENAMPLLLQNLHRYMLYFALGFIVILTWDAWEALWFATPDGGHELGIGVGTLVLGLNAFLLGGYTLGCHSLRHLIGGYADRISLRSQPQQKALDCVSCLNRSHMRWAWFSLAWVCFTDLYVRLCATGVIDDWRLF